MSYFNAEQELDQLRTKVLACIDSFFTEPRNEFDLKHPLVIREADDGDDNDVIGTIKKYGVLSWSCWDPENTTSIKFEDLNIEKLVWLLEELHKNNGEWDADFVDH